MNRTRQEAKLPDAGRAMQEITRVTLNVRPRRGESFAPRFGVPFLVFCALAALVVGCWPLQLSVATVFLFAGPHNWMEFRFFLARMPARWGRSKPFFAVALGGVAALTAGYVTLYALGQTWYLSEAGWTAGAALWTPALLLWLCALVHPPALARDLSPLPRRAARPARPDVDAARTRAEHQRRRRARLAHHAARGRGAADRGLQPPARRHARLPRNYSLRRVARAHSAGRTRLEALACGEDSAGGGARRLAAAGAGGARLLGARRARALGVVPRRPRGDARPLLHHRDGPRPRRSALPHPSALGYENGEDTA